MTPTYPIEGEGIGQLSRLHAIQRYGFIRSGGMPHMGLDLPAKQGTPVLAMYGGVVTGSVSGWEPGDGPKGNFVVIKSKLEDSNDTFLHEYYHLADTKLERGDVVSKGDVIGWVGSTGNSTGPHLHLATRWNRASSDGRSYERKTINPERVIEVGAVDAASEQGLGFGSPARPHLAIPMYILGTISGSSYASPVPPHVVQQLAAGSPQPDPEPVIGGNAGVPHLSNRVKRDDNTERRETIKTAAKEGAKRAAPSVAAVALTAALSSAGVPAPVAAVIASIVKTVLEQQVNGSPDDIIGAVRATVPDWGMPLDEAEKVMIQVANWISQNIQ